METKHAVEALGALAHEYRLQIYRHLVEQGPDGLSAGAIGQADSVDFDAMNGLVGYLTENCCARSGEACATACKPTSVSKAAKRKKVA